MACVPRGRGQRNWFDGTCSTFYNDCTGSVLGSVMRSAMVASHKAGVLLAERRREVPVGGARNIRQGSCQQREEGRCLLDGDIT